MAYKGYSFRGIEYKYLDVLMLRNRSVMMAAVNGVQELIEKVIVTDPEHVEILWKFSDEVMKFIME